LALALCTSDRRRLGFGDQLYEKSSEGTSSEHHYRYIKADHFIPNKEEEAGPEGNEIPEVQLGKGIKVRVDPRNMVHRQFTLFGRATRIEEVEVGEVENGRFVSGSRNYKLVLKVSYQVASRVQEYDIIKLARKIIPEHTPAILGHWVLKDSEMDLPGVKLDKIADQKSTKTDDGYEKRNLVLILMRKYDDVWDLKGEEFMEVFRQGVKGKFIATLFSGSYLLIRIKLRGGYMIAANKYSIVISACTISSVIR